MDITEKIEQLRFDSVRNKNTDELIQIIIEGESEWDELVIQYAKEEIINRNKN